MSIESMVREANLTAPQVDALAAAIASIEDGIRELHQALLEGAWPDPSAPQYYN